MSDLSALPVDLPVDLPVNTDAPLADLPVNAGGYVGVDSAAGGAGVAVGNEGVSLAANGPVGAGSGELSL
ncbi:MAG: hypothetical protein ACRDT8_00975 [Micromonosporaceae bacterium]